MGSNIIDRKGKQIVLKFSASFRRLNKHVGMSNTEEIKAQTLLKLNRLPMQRCRSLHMSNNKMYTESISKTVDKIMN